MSKDIEHRTPPVVGHPGRYSVPLKARFLMLGNFVVFGLTIENEEVQRYLADLTGLEILASRPAELVVSLVLLLLWGGLTVGWMQMVRPSSDKTTVDSKE